MVRVLRSLKALTINEIFFLWYVCLPLYKPSQFEEMMDFLNEKLGFPEPLPFVPDYR